MAVMLAVGLLSQIAPPATLAANPNVGYVDFGFGSAPGSDPTADKPQSKLWWNDGAWWAVMYNQTAGEWHIYQLNWPSQWIDTNTVVDTRPTSRADALWDGSKLYIASLVRLSSSNQALLRRYSYSSASRTYTLDSGFPVTIMTGKTETLAVDKDSAGQLWITYTQGSKVYVNRSTSGDAAWGTPFVLPGTTNVGSDDISSLVAFQDKIGVLWSNQNTDTMYFSSHTAGTADTSWSAPLAIYTGSNAADDHINLKSLQTDSTGRLFAAVKTSRSGAGDTLIHLLSRNAAGVWQSALFGTGSDNHTRPLVLLDTSNSMVYMFATSPTSCGIIYMKSTSMDALSFPAGKGTPFVSSSTYTCINNVTSTKQTVSTTTGLVVLASDESKRFYLHNAIDLGTPPADNTPPVVITKAPAAGAGSIAVATDVTATFSEPVTGVSGSTFTLTAGGTPIAASVSYNAATNTATLNPSADLSFSTTYTAQLSGSIADAASNTLTALSWSFTTAAPPPDSTAPTVIARSPLSGATAVDLAANITATFSEDIAPTSISAASVILNGSSSVAANLSYNAASRTVTLDPKTDLSPSSSYTVQLTSAITDLFGNQLVPVSWSFTTAALGPDIAPPTVIALGPNDAATNVSATTAISATFSEAINSATLTGATFTLTGPSGAVAATITYDSATHTAMLQPHTPLANGATYTARITTVSDLAGNELADEASWSFTTAAVPLDIKLLLPVILR
jgi:methionine-rich copper-binding protein CopC